MPFHFESRLLLIVGLGIAAVALIAVAWRRPALPAWSKALALIGLLLWSLAIGRMSWRRDERQEVVVMVDCSPSTRTAAYRQRATLDARLRELLGNAPHRIVLFADGNRPDDPRTAMLGDIPAERTTFAPPSAAAAILLFSDARFDLPGAGPPTYPVIDPNLESPADGAIQRLSVLGSELVVDVKVAGRSRRLALHGVAATQPIRLEPGRLNIAPRLPAGSSRARAVREPGDPWPEHHA